MTKNKRDYENDDEYGARQNKRRKTGSSTELDSRHISALGDDENFKENPFEQLRERLYILSEDKRLQSHFYQEEHDKFCRYVDDVFRSFADAIPYFDEWIKQKEAIDGNRLEINKTLSYLIFNLGQLSQASNTPLPAKELSIILNYLEKETTDEAIIIARVLEGLALLAKNKHIQLNDSISTSILENLISQVLQFQHISDASMIFCLVGLKELAVSTYLTVPIKTEVINQILQRLGSTNTPYDDAIARIINFLAHIAKANRLTMPLDISLIQPIIEKLNNLISRSESNVFKKPFGLQLLLSNKQLYGTFDAHAIQTLLLHCWAKEPAIETISWIHSVLSQLVLGNHMRGTIDFFRFIIVFQQIKLPPLVIAHIISTAGLLAQKGFLKETIAPQLLQKLIDRFLQTLYPNPHHVGLIFTALVFLVQTNNLDIKKINGLDVILHKTLFSRIDSPYAQNILFGLVELRAFLRCQPEQLRQLLHPLFESKASIQSQEFIKYCHWFVQLQEVYGIEPLNSYFESMLSLSKFSFNDFNEEEQEQLHKNLNLLERNPNCNWAKSLRAKLGIPATRREAEPIQPEREVVMAESDSVRHQAPQARPVTETTIQNGQSTRTIRPIRTTVPGAPRRPAQNIQRPSTLRAPLTQAPSRNESVDRPESWRIAYRNNALFKAIADKNMHQLAVLLDINFPIRPHSFSGSSTSSTRTNKPGSLALSKEQLAANTAVAQLLEETEEQALRILISQATASYFELLLRACSNHARYQLAINNSLQPILLYLPIQELERYISDLISLELYTDSEALIRLTRNLGARAANHPEQREQISVLQTQLFDRAIEFHRLRDHRKVLRALITEKEVTLQINAARAQLTQERPSQPVIRPVEVARPAPLMPQRMFTPRPQRLVVNNRYHYETEDMNRIMRLRLNTLHQQLNIPKITVLTTADMRDNARGNRVLDVLNQYFDGDEGRLALNSQEEQNIIIPIIHNHHWVGIRIQIKHGQAPQVTYYNNVLNYEYDEELQGNILMEVAQALRNHNQALMRPTLNHYDKALIQDDASSCGPMLIESIYCHFKNTYWQDGTPEELAEVIRRRHLRLLYEEDPQFYRRFYAQQANQPEQNNTMAGTSL